MKPGMVRVAADLERDAAAALGGARVVRQDLFQSAVDVELREWPSIAVECKYRQQFKHHRLARETRAKYGRLPIVVTRAADTGDTYAVVPLRLLGRLLDIARHAKQTELDAQARKGAAA